MKKLRNEALGILFKIKRLLDKDIDGKLLVELCSLFKLFYLTVKYDIGIRDLDLKIEEQIKK